MPREHYSDQEKAQCVLWKQRGYGPTHIQRIFCTTYRENSPSRSSIDRWYDDYRARGTHQHRSGNGRPQLSSQVISEIHQNFNNDPALSLRQVAAKYNVHHTSVRNSIKNSQDVPYKLQNFLRVRNGDGTSHLAFTEYCRTQLSTSRSFLKRIVFFDE